MSHPSSNPLRPTLDDLLQTGEYRVMFHGATREIETFTEQDVGQGEGAQSALGVLLTDWPHCAADDATAALEKGRGDTVRVVALLAPCSNPCVVKDYRKFFGLDGWGNPDLDLEGFSDWRRELIASGHDILDYDSAKDPAVKSMYGDQEGGESVALRPELLITVVSLTPAQAHKLAQKMRELQDPFDATARLGLLRELLAPQNEQRATL